MKGTTLGMFIATAAFIQPGIALGQFGLWINGNAITIAVGGSSGGEVVVLPGIIAQPRNLTISGTVDPSAFASPSWAAGVPCYPNCDGSSVSPVLTPNDLMCFMNAYASGDPYANCDGSTGSPILTANDFQCFLFQYAQGCS